MSPILTRPVREQLDHDRVVRLLQARYKRKHDVVINPGSEQNQSVTVGALAVHPDLLLYGTAGGRKLQGTVEVETGESVNHLEALAEWGVFSKLRVPLHIYVPTASVESALRLCTALQIPVAEVWTFHLTFDQARFTMVHRSPEAARALARSASAKPEARAAKPVAKAAKPAAKAAKPAAKAAARKPVAKAKPVKSKPAAKPRAKGKVAAKKGTKSSKRR